ncbi:uncharacterized protein LOC127871166 [Dreissena polymorpha]|uniref:Thaumatin-like protein n=1 Tax=Dreissena polymorpha TaxID=45954 RepID=A0A9D4LCL7_DREPO|nr:uncharacterized protein LOC127871166 [Dreissena polymorpha]XP_052269859.1 uncharacterized protein LOC127871166 [Dreissena polymorpha]KAH3856117.1 hypothetical protein DPMN_098697 [Dreissena polymorpha]
MRLLLCLCVLALSSAHQLRIHNRCPFEIWVGILGNTSPDQGGYALGAWQTRWTWVPNHWSGRVWGRTHCKGNRCETGDCGRGVHCNGAGGVPPVTLAEITFDAGSSKKQDFYDISLVDGYNIQMSINPFPGTYEGQPHGNYYCRRAGCNADLNRSCPSELQVHGTGGVVACKSACEAFRRDDFCCKGRHNTPQTCPPFHYSRIFKNACPQAYSYAYDDQTSTFTCNNKWPGSTHYDIAFCG